MLKKLTLVAFAILALATLSACSDEGDEGTKGPDTNIGALDGACREDGTCDSGLACNTYTKICMKVFAACELGCSDGFECKENGCVEVKPPAPECAVDADCDSGKLCNSGKCEDVGGGGGGGGDDSGGDTDGGGTGGDDGGGNVGWGSSGRGNSGGGGGGDVGRGSSGRGNSDGTGGDSGYYSRGRDDGDSGDGGGGDSGDSGGNSDGGNGGGGRNAGGRGGRGGGGGGGNVGGAGGTTIINTNTHLTLANNIVKLAGSGNFCPAGCPAGTECKGNKCVDIPPPAGGSGQGGSSGMECMAECKPGSTCINGTCTSLINLSKQKIVAVGDSGSSGFQPDAVAEGRNSSGGAVNVAEGGMCSGNNKCKAGLACVNEVCTDLSDGSQEKIDPCKHLKYLEIEPTNEPPPPTADDGMYNYNDSINLSFHVKNSQPGDIIEWTVSRNTAVFWTHSGKNYIDKWNEDVPIDTASCLNNAYCGFEVKFRLGNAKNGNKAKRALKLIDYFRHKITVTAVWGHSQCDAEFVGAATKTKKLNFNKPELKDESIDGSPLLNEINIEHAGISATLYVEDAKHNNLGKIDLFGKTLDVVGVALKNDNGKTFEDVVFFELYGDDDNWAAYDMIFYLHYLILVGEDIYAVVESGHNIMEVAGNDESWHWKVGTDIDWYMRCQPDGVDWSACGEDEDGGNM